MSNTSNTAAKEPEIDVKAEEDVEQWVDELGVDEADLRMAVAEVGTEPSEVRDYLGLAPTDPNHPPKHGG